MDKTVQKKENEKPTLSPLAKDKTYGEKKYDFIFGNLINFWVNLLTSAGFALWVAHSPKKIKLPFVEKAFVPFEKQQQLGNWMNRQFFMKGIANPETRLARSHAMAEMFTLLIPGHVVMLPGIWLGEHYKSRIVKYFDRKHYGAEALESPELKSHYDAIDAEKKPTILGIIVGRLGTILVNQSIVRIIGTGDNIVDKMGFKNGGTDKVASEIGGALGQATIKAMPKVTTPVTNWGTRNFTWSQKQRLNPEMAGMVKGPYTGIVDNFFRLTAMDTMYSYCSAVVIHPLLRLSRKYLPGMAYTLPPKHKTATADTEVIIPAITPVVSPVDAAPDTAPLHLSTETPKGHVHHIKPEATITPRHEHTHSPAGA
jgi:hypothetical protein